jgi:hypothetical protein
MIQPIARAIAAQNVSQRFRFQIPAALDPAGFAVGKSCFQIKGFPVLPIDHIEFPLFGETVPVSDHIRYFKPGIDMDKRHRHMSEKGLPDKPKHNGAVLSDGPEHAKIGKLPVGFP